MKFALATIVQAPKTGWQEPPSQDEREALFRFAAETGFAGIEWSPRWLDFHPLSDGEVERLADEVAGFGLRVVAINLNRFILTRVPEAEAHRERLHRSIAVAEIFGADTVVVSLSLPVVPGEKRAVLRGDAVGSDEFRENAEFLKAVSEVAQRRGIYLTLEVHDDGIVDSAPLALQMVDAVGGNSLRINPDLGNLIRDPSRPQDWREAIGLLAPHTGYWHLKNYRSGEPAPIWDGDIDYRQAITVVEAAGYEGWASIESYFGDRQLELQKASLDWLCQKTSGSAGSPASG